MLSFLLPKNINIFTNKNFIKREGPQGSFIKKVGDLSFNVVTISEGNRLFISGANESEESTALSHRQRLSVGVSRGFRRRLRLVGIGFRATIRIINISDDKSFDALSSIQTENYRRKRLINAFETNSNQQLLSLKIGYSHESIYPISIIKHRDVKASRLDGRSKAIFISLKSNDLSKVNQVATEIRAFRLPDAYKGKGIYYVGEKVKLKKGKRQS